MSIELDVMYGNVNAKMRMGDNEGACDGVFFRPSSVFTVLRWVRLGIENHRDKFWKALWEIAK